MVIKIVWTFSIKQLNMSESQTLDVLDFERFKEFELLSLLDKMCSNDRKNTEPAFMDTRIN